MSGMGAHQGARAKTVVWLTPPEVIRALGGPESFELDPCAAIGQPWPTARRHYTEADNGLLLPWEGRVWLNPPYGSRALPPWLERMMLHGIGTALIFARTETAAFQEYVLSRGDAILFLAGRLTFFQPDGSPGPGNAGAPSVLVAYGSDDADILASCSIDGKFVPLRIPRSMLIELIPGSWREEIEAMFAALGRDSVDLGTLYAAFIDHPKAKRNPNYRAKIRQTLQQAGYRRVSRGEWAKA